MSVCADPAEVRSTPAFKAFRNAVDKLGTLHGSCGRPACSPPDTLKLYTRAHGAKTTNLIINTDHPEYILANEGDQGRSLAELGIGRCPSGAGAADRQKTRPS